MINPVLTIPVQLEIDEKGFVHFEMGTHTGQRPTNDQAFWNAVMAIGSGLVSIENRSYEYSKRINQ